MNNYSQSRGGSSWQGRSSSPAPHSSQNTRVSVIPPDFLRNESINLNDKGKEFVEKVLEASEIQKPNVSMTQIRKFLSAVNTIQNKIQADEKNYNSADIQYIRIKLAYQAGRYRNLKNMFYELDPLIKGISSPADFKKFAQLMEAIVAYHKFYRGDN
jgi:CRISPR type III-A-associated protein Csm2